MKAYSPLGLDTKTTPPSFVNELGVKWWLIRQEKWGSLWRVEKEDQPVYLVLNKNSEIAGEYYQLEAAFVKLGVLELLSKRRNNERNRV